MTHSISEHSVKWPFQIHSSPFQTPFGHFSPFQSSPFHSIPFIPFLPFIPFHSIPFHSILTTDANGRNVRSAWAGCRRRRQNSITRARALSAAVNGKACVYPPVAARGRNRNALLGRFGSRSSPSVRADLRYRQLPAQTTVFVHYAPV